MVSESETPFLLSFCRHLVGLVSEAEERKDACRGEGELPCSPPPGQIAGRDHLLLQLSDGPTVLRGEQRLSLSAPYAHTAV